MIGIINEILDRLGIEHACVELIVQPGHINDFDDHALAGAELSQWLHRVHEVGMRNDQIVRALIGRAQVHGRAGVALNGRWGAQCVVAHRVETRAGAGSVLQGELSAVQLAVEQAYWAGRIGDVEGAGWRGESANAEAPGVGCCGTKIELAVFRGIEAIVGNLYPIQVINVVCVLRAHIKDGSQRERIGARQQVAARRCARQFDRVPTVPLAFVHDGRSVIQVGAHVMIWVLGIVGIRSHGHAYPDGLRLDGHAG